jgi:hypothetical protein
MISRKGKKRIRIKESEKYKDLLHIEKKPRLLTKNIYIDENNTVLYDEDFINVLFHLLTLDTLHDFLSPRSVIVDQEHLRKIILNSRNIDTTTTIVKQNKTKSKSINKKYKSMATIIQKIYDNYNGVFSADEDINVYLNNFDKQFSFKSLDTQFYDEFTTDINENFNTINNIENNLIDGNIKNDDGKKKFFIDLINELIGENKKFTVFDSTSVNKKFYNLLYNKNESEPIGFSYMSDILDSSRIKQKNINKGDKLFTHDDGSSQFFLNDYIYKIPLFISDKRIIYIILQKTYDNPGSEYSIIYSIENHSLIDDKKTKITTFKPININIDFSVFNITRFINKNYYERESVFSNMTEYLSRGMVSTSGMAAATGFGGTVYDDKEMILNEFFGDFIHNISPLNLNIIETISLLMSFKTLGDQTRIFDYVVFSQYNDTFITTVDSYLTNFLLLSNEISYIKDIQGKKIELFNSEKDIDGEKQKKMIEYEENQMKLFFNKLSLIKSELDTIDFNNINRVIAFITNYYNRMVIGDLAQRESYYRRNVKIEINGKYRLNNYMINQYYIYNILLLTIINVFLFLKIFNSVLYKKYLDELHDSDGNITEDKDKLMQFYKKYKRINFYPNLTKYIKLYKLLIKNEDGNINIQNIGNIKFLSDYLIDYKITDSLIESEYLLDKQENIFIEIIKNLETLYELKEISKTYYSELSSYTYRFSKVIYNSFYRNSEEIKSNISILSELYNNFNINFFNNEGVISDEDEDIQIGGNISVTSSSDYIDNFNFIKRKIEKSNSNEEILEKIVKQKIIDLENEIIYVNKLEKINKDDVKYYIQSLFYNIHNIKSIVYNDIMGITYIGGVYLSQNILNKNNDSILYLFLNNLDKMQYKKNLKSNKLNDVSNILKIIHE